jgi:hypothetical protein
LLLTACEEHLDKKIPASPDVQSIVVNNQWRVTSLIDSNFDRTQNFQGYYFNFDGGNNLVVSDGFDNYLGTWSVELNQNPKKNFNIVFTSPDDFTHLSGDWQIESLTDSKIELRFQNKDADAALLTFEKI